MKHGEQNLSFVNFKLLNQPMGKAFFFYPEVSTCLSFQNIGQDSLRLKIKLSIKTHQIAGLKSENKVFEPANSKSQNSKRVYVLIALKICLTDHGEGCFKILYSFASFALQQHPCKLTGVVNRCQDIYFEKTIGLTGSTLRILELK